MLRKLNFAEQRGLWNWIHESAGNPTIRRQFTLPPSIQSLGEAEQFVRRIAAATRALRSSLLWLPTGTPVISTGARPTISFSSDSDADADAVDPLRQSAVFHLKKAGDSSRVDVEMTISHLFADAGGADALVHRLENAESSEDPAQEPIADDLIEGGRSARNRTFWLNLLEDAGTPATPYCEVDRTNGHAATVAVPLPTTVAAQVDELAGTNRVTAAGVWTTAVALAAQEHCTGEEAVVCRLTCANRYTAADATTVDYRAQSVYVPLRFQLDQPASQALRHVHRLSLLAHAHGWYDALDVIEQLNTPSRGAWFLPTVELNVLRGTRGSQDLGSHVRPYCFNPSSAKADVVAGVDDRTVSLTIRGTESVDLATKLLERMMAWPALLGCGHGRPLAEFARRNGLPDDARMRGAGAGVSRNALQALIHAAMGRPGIRDIGLDRSGKVVVHASRPLSADEAVQLWRQQALIPHSVVPDRWISNGIAFEPRVLAEAGLRAG